MKKYFLSLAFFLFVPISVDAFSLSPSKVELTIAPGDTQIVEIKITNKDAVAQKFRSVVMGVEQSEQGAPRFSSGLSEAESWASTKVTDFNLLSGQERKIQFSIDVPMGSYPGSYYLGLGFEEMGQTDGNVNLSGRLLSLVNIKVAGVVNEEIDFKRWEGAKKFWLNPDWRFLAEVKNKGSVDLPLKGELVVYGWGGKKLVTKDLYLGNKLIPGTGRTFNPDISLPSKYVFFPGVYQVDFVLHYGLTNQQMVLSAKVWYLYPPVFFLLLVVVFLPVLFLLGKKIFIHKK